MLKNTKLHIYPAPEEDKEYETPIGMMSWMRLEIATWLPQLGTFQWIGLSGTLETPVF